MRIIDMHRYIGFRPKRRSCSEKKRYSNRDDAAGAAHEYNRLVVFGDVCEYWCHRHQCWHIGHTDKHRMANQRMREDVKFFMFLAIRSELERR